MRYNWEGDLIIHDTAIEKKRFVIGRKQPITTDIREWISSEDNVIMKAVLCRLREKHGLPSTRKPGDFDKRAMVVWKFVTGHVKYVYDTAEYKKADFWLFPPETYQLGKGDCEDGSFLLGSLLISSGISPFCVRVVLGRAYDKTGNPLGGHCWTVYKNEKGRWCILESTLNAALPRMPEADILSREDSSFRYEPLYCFNGHHLWEIFRGAIAKTKGRGLKKYFTARKQKANMSNVHPLL